MSVDVTEYLSSTGGDKFTESSPRPPVPGEENELVSNKSGSSNKSGHSAVSHGSSHRYLSFISNAGEVSCGHSPAMTPRKSVFQGSLSSSKECVHMFDGEPPLGFEPEGSACITPHHAESSTPPYLKWAENLRYLLEDSEGVELFKIFLKSEKCEDLLDFWFACEGLKKQSPENEDQIQYLIKLIYRKYLRTHSICIDERIKEDVGMQIANKIKLDINVFDSAQTEVERIINYTTYPNFLKSDIYLHHVQVMTQNSSGDSGELGGTSSSSSGQIQLVSSILPTVHEDSELIVANTERSGSLPLTRDMLLATQNKRAGMHTEVRPKPEALAGHYLYQGSVFNLTNPYHATYASYVPASRQDSELQSLSSGAHTDDTKSQTDNSSVDNFAFSARCSKKHMRRQYRQIRENASQNKDHMSHQTIIPRTQRIQKDKLFSMEPCEFAGILIQKLELLKKERDMQERLEESLRKHQEAEEGKFCMNDEMSRRAHAFTSLPPALLLAALHDKCSVAATDDNDQSILDDHVSRIWADSAHHTPTSRTPGCLSPRPHSPDSSRRRGILSQGAKCQGAGASGGSVPGIPPHPHPYHLSQHYHRRKDKDVYSTFSSDSGNVHDYFEGPDPKYPHPHSIAKSKSMPEYIEGQKKLEPLSDFVGPPGSESRKPSKDTSRRSSSKKTSTDLTDSGVSVVSDGAPPASSAPMVVCSSERVYTWIRESVKYSSLNSQADSEKDVPRHKARSTHSCLAQPPIPQRHSRGKKVPLAYNTSRSGSLDRGTHLPWGTSLSLPGPAPVTPGVPCGVDLPLSVPPNTTVQLEEAKRRLEGKLSKSKSAAARASDPMIMSVHNPSTVRKVRPSHCIPSSSTSLPPSGFSCEGLYPTDITEFTVVAYMYDDEPVPYRTKLPGREITLRQFKSLLPKKGNYRFYFKTECNEFGTKVIQEEVTEDAEVIPLYDGKIVATIKAVE